MSEQRLIPGYEIASSHSPTFLSPGLLIGDVSNSDYSVKIDAKGYSGPRI